ncbi:MAG: hypothetical protein BWK76_11870 [Desulfobulbaceae bacterium A2]|nr:MAG: hypothetical protein BWK76_11870 [Desulfobulbaceae bacterium A2]
MTQLPAPESEATDTRLVRLLEKQKQELIVRALKKHEEAQAEKAFADRVVASLSDLFFVLDKKLRVVKANYEFVRTVGCTLDESAQCIEDIRLAGLVPAEDIARISTLLADDELRGFETEMLTCQGRRIPVSLNGSTYVTPTGRVLHMMIANDKSEFYRLLSRTREAQEQLAHSARLVSLGEMAAGIAHELTQPLNAILLFARNSLKALADPAGNTAMLEDNLRIIIDRVDKASGIIRTLKTFASKAQDELHPLEVNQVLRNIVLFLEPQLRLSDVAVQLELTDGLPLVLAHEVKLEQIFLNLIQNAIQAMTGISSPCLRIATRLARGFEPGGLTERDYVAIAVSDSGSGISPEDLPRIFDPFFTTREVGGGMGLGLSIVDRIVRSLSGTVKAESTAGTGSCFTVHLPFVSGAAHAGD